MRTDGTGGSNPGGFTTHSDVYVSNDHMYFRGTDDKVWRVRTDGTGGSNPGGFTTHSNVQVFGDSMYFRGTDDKVWRFDFSEGTLRDFATAALETLQGWYSWDNGLWDYSQWLGVWHGGGGWWFSANALNANIDFMSITRSSGYLTVVTNTFDKNKDHNFTQKADVYDDEGWWALTWINAYDLTKDQRYLQMAETIFNDMKLGWDNTCGGGVWWKKDKEYKNAITNELFMAIAIRLYQRTSTAEYLTWALDEWAWFQKSGMINTNNLVNDGLDNTCKNNQGPTFTYNQGVILRGLSDLYAVRQDQTYLTVAQQIADSAINTLVNRDGILTEPCEPTNSCTDNGNDPVQFKGVFIRNLAYLSKFTANPSYKIFTYNNALSVLHNDRSLSNELGLRWSGPFDSADSIRQSSALDALNAGMIVNGTD